MKQESGKPQCAKYFVLFASVFLLYCLFVQLSAFIICTLINLVIHNLLTVRKVRKLISILVSL